MKISRTYRAECVDVVDAEEESVVTVVSLLDKTAVITGNSFAEVTAASLSLDSETLVFYFISQGLDLREAISAAKAITFAKERLYPQTLVDTENKTKQKTKQENQTVTITV